jgi:hypothetical protein
MRPGLWLSNRPTFPEPGRHQRVPACADQQQEKTGRSCVIFLVKPRRYWQGSGCPDNRTNEDDKLMKTKLIVPSLLLIAGNALAGTGYDTCIKEEKALKEQEAGKCSGLSKLLNPSGCFAAQRVLKEQAAKCAEIARIDKPEAPAAPVVVPAIPGKMGIAAPVPKAIEEPARTVSKPLSKAEPSVPQAPVDPELYKEENARLKAEIERLKSENQRLQRIGQ